MGSRDASAAIGRAAVVVAVVALALLAEEGLSATTTCVTEKYGTCLAEFVYEGALYHDGCTTAPDTRPWCVTEPGPRGRPMRDFCKKDCKSATGFTVPWVGSGGNEPANVTWGEPRMCPPGSRVTGFRLKVASNNSNATCARKNDTANATAESGGGDSADNSTVNGTDSGGGNCTVNGTDPGGNSTSANCTEATYAANDPSGNFTLNDPEAKENCSSTGCGGHYTASTSGYNSTLGTKCTANATDCGSNCTAQNSTDCGGNHTATGTDAGGGGNVTANGTDAATGNDACNATNVPGATAVEDFEMVCDDHHVSVLSSEYLDGNANALAYGSGVWEELSFGNCSAGYSAFSVIKAGPAGPCLKMRCLDDRVAWQYLDGVKFCEKTNDTTSALAAAVATGHCSNGTVLCGFAAARNGENGTGTIAAVEFRCCVPCRDRGPPRNPRKSAHPARIIRDFLNARYSSI